MSIRPSICFVYIMLALLMFPSIKAAHCEIVPSSLPMNWAARHGQVKIAKMLIEQGAKIDVKDNFGNTPLHLGIRNMEMVVLLLEHGANANTQNAFGNTPLHLGIKNKEAVEILLQYGADVSIRNVFDKTPLDMCMTRGVSAYNLSVMELLIKAGVK